jgi:CarD family transcriptional regulator
MPIDLSLKDILNLEEQFSATLGRPTGILNTAFRRSRSDKRVPLIKQVRIEHELVEPVVDNQSVSGSLVGEPEVPTRGDVENDSKPVAGDRKRLFSRILNANLDKRERTYLVGDKIVYPNHGVGEIEQISYGVLEGRTERYFMIRILSSGLRVMVPSSQAVSLGLRRVTHSKETAKALHFLETGAPTPRQFGKNSQRKGIGSLLEEAVMMKSLVSLSRRKPLSFREKKQLERAKGILVNAMSTTQHISKESAESLLKESLAKAKLEFPEFALTLEK